MIEIRTAAGGNVSKSRSNKNEIIISGYAIKWGEWSKEIREDGKRFYERITKGAFAASLREKNQFLLEGHDTQKHLASVEAGTLTLKEDSVGLAFKAVLRNRGYSSRINRKVQSGQLSGVSVGFDDISDSWSRTDGKRYRTIKSASLGEISLVGIPAYPSTVVRTGDQIAKLRLRHWEHEEEMEEKKEAIQRKIDKVSKSIDKLLNVLD